MQRRTDDMTFRGCGTQASGAYAVVGQ